MRKNSCYRIVAMSLLLGSATLNAQTINKTADLIEGSTGITTFKSGDQLYFASKDNDKAVKLVALSSSGAKKWEQSMEGYLQHAGCLGGKVLVVVSTDFTLFTRENSTYKAYLLDSKTGKIENQKLLFNGNDEYYTELDVVVGKDAKTFSLIIRETGVKRNVKVAPGALGAMVVAKKMANEAKEVRRFTTMSFNSSLEVIEALSPVVPAGEFIGAVKTLNNDLYIAVCDGKTGVSITRFEAGKEKPSKTVTDSYDYVGRGLLGGGTLGEQLRLFSDTINNNVVYISGSFQEKDEFVCVFNKYEFNSGNHKKFKKSFTRDEFKAFEKGYTPVNSKDFKSLELGSTKDVELLQILESDNGYLLLLSDVHKQQLGAAPPTFKANGLLVYSMDKDLNIKSVTALPRKVNNRSTPEIQAHHKNGTWYVFASHEDKGRMLQAKVSSNSGKVEEIKLIEPPKVAGDSVGNISSMLFTDQGYFLPVLDMKTAFGKIKFDVDLYQISW
ncbi:hypothetical protein [Pedobacter sp. SYSU D00535]|uniref:hypothetical protein n=1 Tax=Pedobacter sp. SYSU D00535 TaxID=2810308 RepID=UPI001A979D97|nr:hypothetical protein [Pedobacter sp. SYSU D00535]